MNSPISNDKIDCLMLPYQGDKSSNLLKSMKQYVGKLLPSQYGSKTLDLH